VRRVDEVDLVLGAGLFEAHQRGAGSCLVQRWNANFAAERFGRGARLLGVAAKIDVLAREGRSAREERIACRVLADSKVERLSPDENNVLGYRAKANEDLSRVLI